METGHNRDPGSLSPEDEIALLELDKRYKDTSAYEIIPSRTKEWVFYVMSHEPAGSQGDGSPDDLPNCYMFFVMGPKHERVNDKVFILFLDETTGNKVRVVNTDGLKTLSKEQDLNDDDVQQEFWRMLEVNGELGSALPNSEDMEDFGDIIGAWQHRSGM